MERFFANPLYGGQDPFVCKGPDGRYYAVAESPDSRQIEVFSSDRLTDRGVRHIAFEAAQSGPASADLWAPELWYLRGKWYIYFAGASAAGMDNWHTHRMFVLEADEPTGPYRMVGELALGDSMCIDGTVMELPNGELLFIYAGKHQNCNALFMAPMASPTEISGAPVLLTQPEYPWESDITEGPFPIVRNGKVSLLYAANAAHLPEYCLALLHCTEPENALDPRVWKKEPQPILTADKDIIGPGHACIVPSPDGREDWLVFHSKFDCADTLPEGWNRVVNLLRVEWDADERPCFAPFAARGEPQRVPSGELPLACGDDVCLRLGESAAELCEYPYYRKKTVFYGEDGLRILGSAFPAYGDKVLLRGRVWTNFEAECTLRVLGGEVGLLARVELPATGAYLWTGCGLFVHRDGWRLVRCADKTLHTLAEGTFCADGGLSLRLRVQGSEVMAWLDGALLCRCNVPELPAQGQFGFGTLGGDGLFRTLDLHTL